MFTGKLEYDTWRGVLLGVRNALATLRDGLPDAGEDLDGLSHSHRRSEWEEEHEGAGVEPPPDRSTRGSGSIMPRLAGWTSPGSSKRG